MADLIYSISKKQLTWDATSYDGISGPYGSGHLPIGQYKIEVRKAVANENMSSSYENTATGSKWFLPLTPNFSTTRHGFGIHPDGNVVGTLGCIGLSPTFATAFWRRWMSKPISARPASLTVVK